MQPSGQPLAIGTLLEGRYRIVALLGQGGMSRVYLADAIRLGMRVAVKENLQTAPASRTQFEREAQILARLAHPNLPRVTDNFTDAMTGRQYLVMEYVEGEDLEAMLKRVRHMPEPAALAWIQQILSALDYLHAQNPPVIHRDIKPANIKITPQGKAVLVDFGIAKMHSAAMSTFTGARAVTPGYAPPEQYGMRTDARSDVYALGATLYTLLTGRTPPEAPLRSAGDALIPPRQLVPTISAQTETAIERALEMRPTHRWQSARECSAGLQPQPLQEATPPFGNSEGAWWAWKLQPQPLQEATPPRVVPTIPRIKRTPVWVKMARGMGVFAVLVLLTGVIGSFARSAPIAASPTIVIEEIPTVIQVTDVPKPPDSPSPTGAPKPTDLPKPPITPSTMPAPRASETRVFAPDNDQKPQHTIYLDAFWMDKFETTNALYKKCVDAGKCSQPSEIKSYTRSSYYGNAQYDNYPVIYVTWDQVKTYCEWASKRLPTEAEWEKAARGTDGRIYSWGNSWDGTRLNFCDKNCPFNQRDNNSDDGYADTSPVGNYSRGASPYGIITYSKSNSGHPGFPNAARLAMKLR